MDSVTNLILPTDKNSSAIAVINAIDNPLLCSKFFLAKKLYKSIPQNVLNSECELVLASIGNLGISLAYLLLNDVCKLKVFLPQNVSKSVLVRLKMLNADYTVVEKLKLKSEVMVAAMNYSVVDDSRVYVDQFELAECALVYTQEIFSRVNFSDEFREVKLYCPVGTGSILYATCQFADSLLEGTVVPVVFDSNGDKSQEAISRVRYFFPRVCQEEPVNIVVEDAHFMFEMFGTDLVFPPGSFSIYSLRAAMDAFLKNMNNETLFVSVVTDTLLSTLSS